MEIKINKEIREYTENIFFGLTLRQFIFSIATCVTTVTIYFLGKNYFGKELTSWLCLAGGVPFAFLGFFKYNGLPAEKVFMNFIKSEILMPTRLLFKPVNYYELLRKEIESKERVMKVENLKISSSK